MPDPFRIDEENPEWTPQAAAEAKPFGELFPRQLAAQSRSGPTSDEPKVHIGFHLAADVAEAVRASGPGYDLRVERTLRKALADGDF